MKDDKILESELNQNVDVGTAEDVEAVMKKYDRESNTRVWEGKPGVIVRWCSILFSLYSIYVTLFSTACLLYTSMPCLSPADDAEGYDLFLFSEGLFLPHDRKSSS